MPSFQVTILKKKSLIHFELIQSKLFLMGNNSPIMLINLTFCAVYECISTVDLLSR